MSLLYQIELDMLLCQKPLYGDEQWRLQGAPDLLGQMSPQIPSKAHRGLLELAPKKHISLGKLVVCGVIAIDALA